MTGKSGYMVDFSDIFPRMASRVWHPFVTVAPLGNPLKSQVILHEQQVRHPRLLTWHNYTKTKLCEGKGKGDSHLQVKIHAFIKIKEGLELYFVSTVKAG